MIYEIGAGGIIAVPPRKHEYHRVALWGPHGVAVGEPVIDTDKNPVPWQSTKHERYTQNVYNTVFGFRATLKHRRGDLKLNYANRAIPIKESAMPIEIDGHGNETHIPREPEGRVIDLGDGCSVYRSNRTSDAPEVEYERYYRDIPRREASGKIVVVEIDGVKEIVYDHRKGDIILNSAGYPRIIEPGVVPCPRWFTREYRESPSPRYDDRIAYHRSLDGITNALDELSDDDLRKLDTQVSARLIGRTQGTHRQVVKSKYAPVCVVYGGGELQFEVFDDEGNISEALTEAEFKAKYGVAEA